MGCYICRKIKLVKGSLFFTTKRLSYFALVFDVCIYFFKFIINCAVQSTILSYLSCLARNYCCCC